SRSSFRSSSFSNSKHSAKFFADAPSLPFHSLIRGYVFWNQTKSSCHLPTSANRCAKSQVSDSGISARVGTSTTDSRTKYTKSATETQNYNEVISYRDI